jgi:hypothetical protein
MEKTALTENTFQQIVPVKILFFICFWIKKVSLYHYYMEPGDQQDTPLNKILHFI